MSDVVGALQPSRHKLVSLEIGRGIAALAVVANHAGLAANAFTTGNDGGLTERGALGVDFFFVLSGFIIFYVHGRDSRGIAAAGRYIGKRLRRIYLPYLPISFALILAYTALPGLSEGGRDWGLLTSLTLLPTGHPPALSVAWTLIYEMMFYLFFLAAYATRYFWVLVAGWAGSVIVFDISGLHDGLSNPFLRHAFDPIVLEFIVGMATAWLFVHRNVRGGGAILLAGLFATVCTLAASRDHNIFLALSFAVVIFGAASLESQRGLYFPSSLALFGAASYAIYLVHNPLISLVARAMRPFDNWVLTFAVCAIAGVIAGLAYHLAIEKPLLRNARLRRPATG